MTTRRLALATNLLVLALLSAPPARAARAAEGGPTAAGASSAVENAVVKIFTTRVSPDTFRPWTRQTPNELTGSGVVIEGRRILTNAHVVLYASQVQVQANQAGDKVAATVEAIAPGIDLAVLRLDDEAFFQSHAPLKRAPGLPRIKDTVLAYGFPTGGSSLAITKGIVSRIEYTAYNYQVSGLRIQIDAAINPGNSGGPAVAGDRMVGLAFSHLRDADNIGYIIPNEEIELFLRDIADGRYEGKPAMFDELQTLENPALRQYLRLGRDMKGMVVTRPNAAVPGNPLREWDIIARVGDVALDDEGMIQLPGNVRVSFRYAVQGLARNGRVPLTVVRDGRPVNVEMPTSVDKPMLVPDLQGEYPPYFIYGPVVFSKATNQFLALFANSTAIAGLGWIQSPLMTQRTLPPTPEREELVVVSSPFFPHKLAKGYSNPTGSVILSVNGHAVRSLRHLVELLRDLQDEFVVLRVDHRYGETLVFPRREIVAATEGILTDNGVRAQGSPELLDAWKGRPRAP